MRNSSQETPHFRELVHEPSYSEALERIFHDIQRADDIMEGLETFVSRSAEMGMAYQGYDQARVSTWLSKRIPEGRVRVLYAYTEEVAHLLNAWVIPAHLDGKFF